MVSRFLTALPVFNEELHVQEVLAEVRKYAGDILVVDDGSTDRTPELLSREMDVRVLTHEVNQGYGAALRTAFEFATEEGYDALVTIDCDGQHEPSLIPEIVAALDATAEHPLDLVSGSRYAKRFQGDSQAPAERKRINEEITAWLNCKFGWKLTDAFCGFKAYRVATLDRFHITELSYGMPLQLWVQAAALGLRIEEFPVPLVYLDEKRSFGGALDDGEQRRKYYFDILGREVAAQQLPVTASCGDSGILVARAR